MFKVIICPPCMLQLCDLQFCCFTAKYCSILLGTGPSRFGAGSVVTVVVDPFWISWLRIRLQRGRPGFYPWLGKSPGEGKGYPLQYSGLEYSMDYIVHCVAKPWTGLSGFHFLCLQEPVMMSSPSPPAPNPSQHQSLF